jgi:hypothetical protein
MGLRPDHAWMKMRYGCMASSRPVSSRKTSAGGPGVRKKTDLASPAMSPSDVAACFIGTFLGLVAAAVLIAVLG